MNKYKRIYIIPITLFSTVAIVHNTYLAKETANLHTGSVGLDWALAGVFAFAIEAALWTLIINQKFKAVKAYAVLLFVLNLIYYGRGGKLHQIIALLHPEAWTYVEGILMALIFSVLLSGFLWYLTEVAIEDIRGQYAKVSDPQSALLTQSVSLAEPSSPILSSPIPSAVFTPILDTIKASPVNDSVPEHASTPYSVKESSVNNQPVASQTVVNTPATEAEALSDETIPMDAPTIGMVAEVDQTETNVASTGTQPIMRIHSGTSERRCLHCQTPLTGKRPNAVFCDPTCKQKYYRSKPDKVMVAEPEAEKIPA